MIPARDDKNTAPTEPLVEETISRVPISVKVRQLREGERARDERLEPIIAPRIAAQRTANRLALDQLEAWHREVGEQTNLDLVGYSRGSAIWLLGGRLLGLSEAFWVQIDAGITNEMAVTSRAIFEAASILPLFRNSDEEEIVRLWLDDDGKYRYVKMKEAQRAQQRFEEQLSEKMEEIGLPTLESSIDKGDEMYDRLSRFVHNRRSVCVDSLWERGREMAYGRNPSILRRASAVEYGGTVTVQVVQVVGSALETFRGQHFFSKEVLPLVAGIEAARDDSPLDERSILTAAGIS